MLYRSGRGLQDAEDRLALRLVADVDDDRSRRDASLVRVAGAGADDDRNRLRRGATFAAYFEDEERFAP